MKPLTPEQYAKIRQYYSDEEIRAQGYEIPGPVAGTGITPGHSKFSAQQLEGRADRQVENAQDAQGVSDHPVIESAIAAPLTVAQGFPGGERAAVGMSLLGRLATGQDANYGEALQDERNVTADVPFKSKALGHIAGGAATLGIPGMSALSAPAQGGSFGLANGALSADEMSTGGRVLDAASQGIFGAALGRYGAKALKPVAKLGGSALKYAANTGPGQAILDLLESAKGTDVADLLPSRPATSAPAVPVPAAPDVPDLASPDPQIFRGKPVRSVADVLRERRGMMPGPSIPSPSQPSPYVTADARSSLAQLIADQEGIQPDPATNADILQQIQASLLRRPR